jgi:hypothetical protein
MHLLRLDARRKLKSLSAGNLQHRGNENALHLPSLCYPLLSKEKAMKSLRKLRACLSVSARTETRINADSKVVGSDGLSSVNAKRQ